MNPFKIIAWYCMIAWLVVWSCSAAMADSGIADPSIVYRQTVRPVIQKYCSECHNDSVTEAEIDLTSITSLEQVRESVPIWLRVVEVVDSHQMPPKDARQWSDDERLSLLNWTKSFLREEAIETAGDPGPALLRRLNNAEYTYSLRDLTGIESLDPASEFPIDGAAGEGFTNASAALSMSPALVSKYLDAAKEVAKHLVLLPNGTKFSPHTTPSDWTNDTLAEIRKFYDQYADPSGGSSVNLQGIVFDTNQGGRLAIEKYLAALLESREALVKNASSLNTVATNKGLSNKYLSELWGMLGQATPQSLLLESLRGKWSRAATTDAEDLRTEIAKWQSVLWRFSSIGHIGKVNGPKAWQEPVNPLIPRQEIRSKIASDQSGDTVTYYLAIGDAGDGNAQDMVMIERPRLMMNGRPDLLLRDLRPVVSRLSLRRENIIASTEACLLAASEAQKSQHAIDVIALAAKYKVAPEVLSGWLDYLGIGTAGEVITGTLLNRKMESASGYDFISGWVGDDALSVIANSSDQHVRVPGNMWPHSVAVHPSPNQSVAIGWKSHGPMQLRVEGFAQHAHPECGNGVAWNLELRRGNTRQSLANGIAHGANRVAFGPVQDLSIQLGDVISLTISPRDGNHSCDLTTVDLKLTSGDKSWSLANDLSSNILASNPHADGLANANAWVMFSEPAGTTSAHSIPAGSLLAKWQSTSDAAERQKIAASIQQLLRSGVEHLPNDSRDRILHRELTNMGGPLMGAAIRDAIAKTGDASSTADDRFGLPKEMFGQQQNGTPIEPASICVQAPDLIEIKLPSDLAVGAELVTSCYLHPTTGQNGSVQVQLLTQPPAGPSSLTSAAPVLVNDGSESQRRFIQAFDDFRSWFPVALCYTKIVPVDEVVTLTLFYREDEHLQRLMLNAREKEQLDRLWNELHFVSRDPLTLVDAYEQLWQYATQDADPSAFEPLREPILQRAAQFRSQLEKSQPSHVESILQFATRAYRRPMTTGEQNELRQLYHDLRSQELQHEDATRLMFARVLVAPAFLYRLENPGNGHAHHPVSDWELATRLSYFLWSSVPDDELRHLALEGKLHETDELKHQTQRMLRDPKAKRLATEFACQWLHVYDFAQLDEKSESVFPTFRDLRQDMYEESIRFFEEQMRADRPFRELFDSDHAMLNESLAKHYGIPDVVGPQWRRVDGVKQHHRGGVLTMASTLAKQSGASRTSPILRGNWLSEVVLGERLPRPPKNVPPLAESKPDGMTERQMIEKHSSDPACNKCHARIDPFGYSLEAYDAIGRFRRQDASGLAIDTRTQLLDRTKLDGIDDLRRYLTRDRSDAVARQFCKKLLGFALGRSVQLSDELLLDEMTKACQDDQQGLQSIVQRVVGSTQFQNIRANP